MLYIVHQPITHLITLRRWVGRAGVLVLCQTGLQGKHAKLAICNFHGGHGDDVFDSLSDLRAVTKCIPHQCTKVLCGDYNIDILPDDDHDPYKGELGRHNRHLRERGLLATLLIRLGVDLLRPTHYVAPVPTFCAQVGQAIVTRRPSGLSHKFSTLDYVCASGGSVGDPGIDWLFWPSDHGALVFDVSFRFRTPHRRVTFQPVTENHVKEWVVQNFAQQNDLSSFTSFALQGQAATSTRSNARQRSHERLSLEVRNLYSRAASADTAEETNFLLKIASTLRARAAAERRAKYDRDSVAKGKVLLKSRRLHTIEELRTDDGVTQAEEDIAAKLEAFFRRKWEVHKYQSWETLKDFIIKNDCVSDVFQPSSVTAAFKLVRKVNKLDREGIPRLFLRVFFKSFPDEFTYLLNATLGSTTIMTVGRFIVKYSANPAVLREPTKPVQSCHRVHSWLSLTLELLRN